MIKILLFIFVNFFFFNGVLAKDININEDINLEFKCSLEKKIIKNSEYNGWMQNGESKDFLKNEKA